MTELDGLEPHMLEEALHQIIAEALDVPIEVDLAKLLTDRLTDGWYGPDEVPGDGDPATILAAGVWRTNGELIADVAKLYLDPALRTLDPTYNRGLWWTLWRPHDDVFTYHNDYDPETGTGTDFRRLPHPDGYFDQVAYDPPYVSMGGRKTTGIEDFYDRYGLMHAPATPELLQQMIDAGSTEMRRVIKPRGILLVKCQDYITSGNYWDGTSKTKDHLQSLGFRLVDRFEHLSKVRPQPKPQQTEDDPEPDDGQVHSRRNLSTLFVFEAPAQTGSSLFD